MSTSSTVHGDLFQGILLCCCRAILRMPASWSALPAWRTAVAALTERLASSHAAGRAARRSADTRIAQLRRPGCPASASTLWEESILARILAAVRSMRAASIAAPKPLSICRQVADASGPKFTGYDGKHQQ